MAGEPVPADDLPGAAAAVPNSDLPQPKPATGFDTALRMARSLVLGGPMGLLGEGTRMASEGQETIADYAGGAVTDFTDSPAAGAATKTALSVAGPGALGGTAGRLVQAPAHGVAKWLMQQALKPTAKALKNTGATGTSAERAAETLLDEGYTVSRSGVAGMERKVDALDEKITNILSLSDKTIDKHAVAARLQDVINKIERTDLHPQERVAQVEKIYTDVLSAGNIPRDIPVAHANEIKQAIYKKLKDKYGELGSDAVESEKALARGLKEEIGVAHPLVSKLGKQEADLINAIHVAQHRALIAGNRDMAGIGWLIQHPMAFAAFMADRSPLFKSIIAQMINRSTAMGTIAGGGAGAAQQK